MTELRDRIRRRDVVPKTQPQSVVVQLTSTQAQVLDVDTWSLDQLSATELVDRLGAIIARTEKGMLTIILNIERGGGTTISTPTPLPRPPNGPKGHPELFAQVQQHEHEARETLDLAVRLNLIGTVQRS